MLQGLPHDRPQVLRDEGGQLTQIIKPVAKHIRAAKTEVEILESVQENGTTDMILNFIESFDLDPYFVIVFELLGPNLYQLMKERPDRKCSLREIQVG